MSRDQRIWPRKEETWTDFARDRWDTLSQNQARAIVHYLEWCVERDTADVQYGIVQALSAYWYLRCANDPIRF
jgi:hypothetical protein